MGFVYLGIDTSCYTTSLALIDQKCTLLEDKRIVLPVSSGKQGLQQSTALFYHLQNLPVLLKEAFKEKNTLIKAVAVSSKPRPHQDSYMPVFTAGQAIAQSLAACLGIPLVETTHQEGHLVAGLWSAGIVNLESCLALHLSGGTTDIFLFRRVNKKPLQYAIHLLGNSTDIHVGQLIDRVGVFMGLGFPAGAALEKLAQKVNDPEQLCVIPSAVKGYSLSFSGAETKAKQLLKAKVEPAQVARAIERCVATSIEKVLKKAIKETGINHILLVGGVAANQYIRQRLKHRLEHKAIGASLYFPEAKYSSDNAVGVSLIARSLFT